MFVTSAKMTGRCIQKLIKGKSTNPLIRTKLISRIIDYPIDKLIVLYDIYEGLLHFFAIYYSEPNIFWFWTIDRKKRKKAKMIYITFGFRRLCHFITIS